MPRPLSKYIGGKQRLAIELINIMPSHEKYIEGFSGMASVFLTKPKAKINIINDLNDSIVNLFQVARDTPQELINLIELTPYAKAQFEEWSFLYLSRKNDYNKLSPLKRALIFYYVLFCSYNSEYMTQKTLSTFSVKTAASWGSKNSIENIISFSKWTQGTVFTNMDYRELLRKYADNTSLIYLDPPYTMAEDKKYYEHNFGQEQHEEMRNLVAKYADETGAKFVISYDESPLIRELYSDNKRFWISQISDVPQSSSNVEEGTGKRTVKTELVITTYNPSHSGLFSYQL